MTLSASRPTVRVTPGAIPRSTASRRESLRVALPESLDMLYRRRACDIPEGFIEDYVALNWLEWHGGTLRVTTTGENVVRQVLAPAR